MNKGVGRSKLKKLSPLKAKVFVEDQECEPISVNVDNNDKNITTTQYSQNSHKQKSIYEQQFNQKSSKLKLKVIGVFIVIAIIIYVLLEDRDSQIGGFKNYSHSSLKQQESSSRNQESQKQKQDEQQFDIVKSDNPNKKKKQQQKQIPSFPAPKLPSAWFQQQKASATIDKYFLKVQMDKVIGLSRPDRFFGDGLAKSMAGMTFNQLQMSIRLLQVIHNVNFKGQIEIQAAPYDKDLKQKQKRIRMLLQMQQKFFDMKYEYKKYMSNQLPFCIVVPSYNNVQSRLYLRNLDSLFMQNYQNYHIVYIDDASPDQTGKKVLEYVEKKKIPKQKIKVIINDKNLQALNNIYDAVHNECQLGEIVAIVDGDDSLIGREILGLYNAVYQNSRSGLVYSNYLHIIFNQKAVIGGSSRPIPYQLLQLRRIRAQKAFATSHLLTFYVDIFRMIKKQDLTYSNGTFFRYSYDVGICTPMIQMLGTKVHYIPELTYQYRFDTGQNDPSAGQQQVSQLIYSKPVYPLLKQYPFIDDRENYLKNIKQGQKGNKQNQQKQK